MRLMRLNSMLFTVSSIIEYGIVYIFAGLLVLSVAILGVVISKIYLNSISGSCVILPLLVPAARLVNV